VYGKNLILRFSEEANQSNRCHPTSPLPPVSLGSPSSFSSPEEATRLRRSVTPPRMLDFRGPSPPFILSNSFPKPSAALATPSPRSRIDRVNSSAVREDSVRRDWEGESGGSGSRISTHHRTGREVETLTTGSEGMRWFEVDTKPSKEVSPSYCQPGVIKRRSPRFHLKPSVVTIAESMPTGRIPHVCPMVVWSISIKWDPCSQLRRRLQTYFI
jgi:hypothetical protein